jgi:hypothetical protein
VIHGLNGPLGVLDPDSPCQLGRRRPVDENSRPLLAQAREEPIMRQPGATDDRPVHPLVFEGTEDVLFAPRVLDAVAQEHLVTLLPGHVLDPARYIREKRVGYVRYDEANSQGPVGGEAARHPARAVTEAFYHPHHRLAGRGADLILVVEHPRDRLPRDTSLPGYVGDGDPVHP